MVLSLHIGAGFDLIKKAPEAPIDHLIILTCQIAALVAQDLLFGPTLRRFPDLKVALSEGGIGWIPFYLDRADRHFENQAWLENDFGGKLPSDVFRDHILACYITDPSGLELRHRIGIDTIAWECDYPHTDTTWPESPEFAWKEFQEAGCSDQDIQKITWENSCRFFGWDPFKHTPKDQATVGRLAVPGQGRRHHPHGPGRVERSATRAPASASSSHVVRCRHPALRRAGSAPHPRTPGERNGHRARTASRQGPAEGRRRTGRLRLGRVGSQRPGRFRVEEAPALQREEEGERGPHQQDRDDE